MAKNCRVAKGDAAASNVWTREPAKKRAEH